MTVNSDKKCVGSFGSRLEIGLMNLIYIEVRYSISNTIKYINFSIGV
jgi:hypothetical protein